MGTLVGLRQSALVLAIPKSVISVGLLSKPLENSIAFEASKPLITAFESLVRQ